MRKFFRTRCQFAGVDRDIIENLMGHRGGSYLAASYFRTREDEVLEEYRKALGELTISEGHLMRDEYTRRVGDLEARIKELEERCAQAASLLEKRLGSEGNGDSNNPGMFG